ncbi:GGDEF domain-containing protein [Deinococcus koreensis]|uniref:GGDEF domain-containing protein n=1 Tax=Deinococcus koreensis TaxID=2054903 RepID=A0A2K3UXP6_9DEIO|nr:GGDEF domain-containing protein [Deinococcus koreensis]PNY81313.1 hypothetical protein CVO96_07870 [Deinococcus koreensis]
MPVAVPPEQHLDLTRRRGYLFGCLGAAVAYGVLSIDGWAAGDWRPLVGMAVCSLLILTVLDRRITLQRLDGLLGLASDFGALFMLWSVFHNAGPFSAQTMLMFSIFLVVWFGVRAFRAAVIRAALLCAGILLIGLLRQPPEPIPVLYFVFLAFLVGQMTFAGRQIRQEASARAHYADLALTDPLTGLLNRRALYETLQAHYTRQASASRPAPDGGGKGWRAPGRRETRPGKTGGGETGLGVLLLDLDHFKTINDSYGHDIGDRVLQHVAGVLEGCAAPGDQVARWGGEEFLILVSTSERSALEQRCHRILAALRTIHSGLPPVTLSIGMAHASEAPDVDSLLRLADRRLYRAKRDGRDRMNKDTLLNL